MKSIRSWPGSAVVALKPHLVPLGLITLAAAIFFAPVLFGGYWLPNGGGDLAVFLWPTYSFASHSLKAGQLPLWNPYLYSGAPFWADNQSSVLYPPTLLVMLLTDVPYQALEALVIGHVWLAGVAMYIFACGARSSSKFQGPSSKKSTPVLGTWNLELGAHLPALLPALLWMFSDGFVTHIGNLNLIAAAAWLPLVMLGTWRALRDLNWKWSILGGVTWGLVVLAGHAQIAYFAGLMIGGAGVWWAGIRLRNFIRRGVRPYALACGPGADNGGGVSPLLATAGLLILVLALGLALSAGSWLPALEMAAQTGRAGLTYEEAAKYSLPPGALVGVVAPWVYGRGPAGFIGGWDRVEVGYIGAVGLAMSLWGAWVAIRRKNTLGIFLVVVGVLSFRVALGNFAPLHRLAFDLIPGFRNFRAPARYILLMNFAQAMLAGIGLRPPSPLAPLPVGEGSKADIPSPPGGEGRPGNDSRRRRGEVSLRAAIPLALTLLAAAEMIGFGMTAEIDQTDPRAGFDHPEAVAWITSQPNRPFRIDAAPAGHWQQDLAARVSTPDKPIYDIYGVSNPLALAGYENWYWAVGYRGSPTYNFLGVRYVLAEGGPPADATFKPVASFADGITIYENTRALPMALIVPRAVAVESAARASDLAHAEDWDPRRVVYVEGGPELPGDSTSGGSVTYTEYSGNRIAISAATSGPAYLVLSEVFFPGWVATIDGKPAPIYRANATFRAVYIDTPGDHTVVMEFKPPLVPLGLAISGVTLAALIGVMVWFLKRGPSEQGDSRGRRGVEVAS